MECKWIEECFIEFIFVYEMLQVVGYVDLEIIVELMYVSCGELCSVYQCVYVYLVKLEDLGFVLMEEEWDDFLIEVM